MKEACAKTMLRKKQSRVSVYNDKDAESGVEL